MNVWGPYQAHVNFRWSRSASFIEAGLRDGLGYRDTLQDVQGVVHTVASEARDTIVKLLGLDLKIIESTVSFEDFKAKYGADLNQ